MTANVGDHICGLVETAFHSATRLFSKTMLILLVVASWHIGSNARAAVVVLDFQDIAIPGGTDVVFFTYQNSGFTLTATNPPTGLSSGFQAHGPNSIFFAGKVGVAAFSPVAPPDNLIQLVQDNGEPFSLTSIELARNFQFDPAPTVTFTGSQLGGGIVTETFTVTTPAGVAAFQSFDFTGFTNLESVTWGQPVLAEGNHQFTNIELITAPAAVAAEPSISLLVLIGVASLLTFVRKRPQPHSER